MVEPWFDPNNYAWIPGTAYGIAAAWMGAVVGFNVPKGKKRGFILKAWFTLWAIAVVLMIAGVVAVAAGQPWGVWFAFLLPGVIGTLVVGANSVVIIRSYRVVEQRRLAAKDLL